MIPTSHIKLSLVLFMLIMNWNISSQTVQNFELNDLENDNRSFYELKGENLTLIDFWATWCSPCKKAIPELNKIYDEYNSEGVEIIGINCDGPRSVSKVEPFSKALRIKYPVLIDMDSEIKNELNLISFPTLIIVNSANQIVWTHEGYTSGDAIIIREAIEEYLSAK